jgi:hypothetical protein
VELWEWNKVEVEEVEEVNEVVCISLRPSQLKGIRLLEIGGVREPTTGVNEVG